MIVPHPQRAIADRWERRVWRPRKLNFALCVEFSTNEELVITAIPRRPLRRNWPASYCARCDALSTGCIIWRDSAVPQEGALCIFCPFLLFPPPQSSVLGTRYS